MRLWTCRLGEKVSKSRYRECDKESGNEGMLCRSLALNLGARVAYLFMKQDYSVTVYLHI